MYLNHLRQQQYCVRRTAVPSAGGVSFSTAVEWSAGSLRDLLAHPVGRQLFRVFMEQSFADENVNFYDGVDALLACTDRQEQLRLARDLLDHQIAGLNISMNVAKRLCDSVAGSVQLEPWRSAQKEIYKLMAQDRFVQFKNSDVYLDFLRSLAPADEYAKWARSLDALLTNPIGRHHLRVFLRRHHAEENLRFIEAVDEFRTMKQGDARRNGARSIIAQYLAENAPSEVHIVASHRKQMMEAVAVESSAIDAAFFDEAVNGVKAVMRGDMYARFIDSDDYKQAQHSKQ